MSRAGRGILRRPATAPACCLRPLWPLCGSVQWVSSILVLRGMLENWIGVDGQGSGSYWARLVLWLSWEEGVPVVAVE